MKYKTMVICSLFLLATSACHSNEESRLDLSGYSKVFSDSLNTALSKEPNFNHDMYIFDYPCGGGALCANIYNPKNSIIIDFPDEYLIENEGEDLIIDYQMNRDFICVTGFSAYDLTHYENTCYILNGDKLVLRD